MTNEAQAMTQTDVTLADLYRYLAEERKIREGERKAREESTAVAGGRAVAKTYLLSRLAEVHPSLLSCPCSS